MLQYKGYMISGCSVPMYMQGCQSRGSVCKAGRAGSVIELERIGAGSVIELERIDGKVFKTTKEAEAHGLELAREWVDRKTALRA